MQRLSRYIAGVLLMVLLSGCAYYSFTGATLPSHLDTVSLPLAEDNTTSPINTLDEDLTRLLNDRFVGQTRLNLETNESNADAVLDTRITQYENRPSGVGGDGSAGNNRVSITVSAVYFDQVEDEELVNETFSSSEEYSPAEDGPDGEEAAALAVLEDIATDIFSSATSDW